MKDFPKLIFAIALCEIVGLLSTPITIHAIATWYISLNKPPFSPPNWVFAPVWTILYGLMGAAAYVIWKKGTKKKNVKHALLLFGIQLLLNFLWSLLFFGLHSPILGLLDITTLFISILLTIFAFYKISKSASYLLIPYLLWVCFAMLLNIFIAILNH